MYRVHGTRLSHCEIDWPPFPPWLVRCCVQMPELIADLKKEVPSSAAEVAWRDYGQVLLAADREDMCAASDEIASEHLHVQCRREELDWYHARLTNYGSLFLGEETTVSYGDKCSGSCRRLSAR